MDRLTFKNPYGDSILIGSLSDEYILISRGDIGGIEVANTIETGYLQRGTSVTQKRITQKSYPIIIGVKGATNAEFKAKMNKLSRFFEVGFHEADDITPFEMKISANGYDPKIMNVFIQKTPTLLGSVKNGDLSSRYQRAILTIFAPDPIWLDEAYSSITVESQTDLFAFPIEITDSFVFAEVTEGGVEVDNKGDLSAPIIITFTGLSTNPFIENMTYGEKLKLLTTIGAGDVVTINTDYNNPSVTITSGGVTTSAFKYIDPDNNALNMTLRRGINVMNYGSDDLTRTFAGLQYKTPWMSPFSGVL